MAKEDFTGLLGAGTEYQGQLQFKGTVRIDGRFAGSIASEGKLILGKDGVVQGTINISELVVHGTLDGDVTVTKRTILHQTARVNGSLTTPLLAMEEGALLQGEVHMNPEALTTLNARKTQALPRTASPMHVVDESVKQ